MNKKISFEKKIKFPTQIGEVCSISLEKNLIFKSEDSIEGELFLTGKYKLTEASLLEEDFSYKIPIEISLTEELDTSKSGVDISDFYYEIENDDTMICYIDLEIDGEELKKEEVRECDGDSPLDKEIEIPVLEPRIEMEEDSFNEVEIISNNVDKNDPIEGDVNVEEDMDVSKVVEEKSIQEAKSIFQLDDEEDRFGTFVVSVVREGETVNTILEKYQTTLEKLEQYNDLKDFSMGMKIIIPIEKEDE